MTGEERTEAATALQGSGDGADIPTDVEPLLVLTCPMCGWQRHGHMYGPTYKPRRWFRRTPFWRCTWCKYEWEEGPTSMPDPLVVPGAPGVPGAETPGQPASPYVGSRNIVGGGTVGIAGCSLIALIFGAPLLALLIVASALLGGLVGVHVQAIREADWQETQRLRGLGHRV